MTKPSVLIIAFSKITSDARVLKQIAALRDDNELTVVGYGAAPGGVAEFISIPDELVYWRYDRRALILRVYSRAYWRNPVISHLAAELRGRTFDAILANDIDTVGLAVSLEPRGGVHADLHEYAPGQKEELPRWRLFVAPFVSWMLRRHVTAARSVTTVSGPIADAYSTQFGIEAGVVTNAAPFEDRHPTPTGDPIRLVHSGACLRDRHLEIMIDAVGRTDASVELDLYLTPNDPDHFDELVALAAGDERIRVNAAVPYSELPDVLARFDVGVFVLPPVNRNYEWALPNKFFDFVQARLGIIVGPTAEMGSIVVREHLGIVTSDFTAGSLADALDSLDADVVSAWKAAAHSVAPVYSAENSSRGWVDAVARLTAQA